MAPDTYYHDLPADVRTNIEGTVVLDESIPRGKVQVSVADFVGLNRHQRRQQAALARKAK